MAIQGDMSIIRYNPVQSAKVQNLGYKGWDELLKFTLKSPRSMKLENWGMLMDVIKLDKVSKIELGEFGGRYKAAIQNLI